MAPLESASSASTSSLLESASPTSEPSKYIVHAPLVTSPSVVGVKANISSSAPAVTPVTTGLPVVEISTRPSESRLTESMLSADVVNSTSEPFRYMLNVPVVTLPNEPSNCTTS